MEKVLSTKQIQELDEKLNKSESSYTVTIGNYKKELTNLESLYNESQVQTKDIVNRHEALSRKWKETLSSNQEIKRKLANNQRNMHSLDETASSLKKMNEKYQKKESLLLNENKSLREQLNQATISMQRLQRKQHFNQKINCH